jgi:signal transduction histidine kinase
MEKTIARCRVLLSIVAVVAIYLDPTGPTMLPGLNLRGGSFAIDPRALAVLLAHLLFSVVVYGALTRGVVAAETIGAITTWADVLFAGAIAAFTEGASSPFYAFFVFAVMASGFRAGARHSAAVIVVAVTIYLGLVLVSGQDHVESFYLMRPVYLAIVGYLIAHLGHQRIELEATVRRLEAREERNLIAASLHDGSLQTLVAVGLRLEGCRELLREGRHAEALGDLSRLQEEVTREHEGLRSYVRGLARVGSADSGNGVGHDPSVSIDARFSGSPALVEDVLQIAREALANVRRHASASAATISVRAVDERVLLAVDDDGVGFAVGAQAPWSIGARVRAAGGDLRIEATSPGGHLRIAFPRGSGGA